VSASVAVDAKSSMPITADDAGNVHVGMNDAGTADIREEAGSAWHRSEGAYW
jgi:hypothetical protein